MKQIARQIKPASGFGSIFHTFSLVALPILLFILVGVSLVPLAIILVLFSKWRIFAVRSRYWLSNIRTNLVDIFVGVSIVLLMAQTSSQTIRVVLAAMYALWLIFIKPKSSVVWVGLQAIIGQTIALHTIYNVWGDRSIVIITLLVGLVCVASARHFLASYGESMARAIAYAWGYVAASIAWLTAHWLVFYGPIAQPVLLLTVFGYGLAALYYLQYKDRLSHNTRRQVVVLICAIAFFLIMFSGSADNIVQ